MSYAIPAREANLKVVFTSPQGETSEVYGFWDGGKVWRVRFCPTQLGRWTFLTSCSDPANKGLHQRAGEFLCTAPSGKNRFTQHGPVRVARDRRHLEHADGTAFFWLADTAWDGPRVAGAEDWENYARTRAAQQFTVIQWSAAPGLDGKRQSAFGGKRGNEINPLYFQHLDARLETLSRAGLLSAIAAYTEEAAPDLADEQIALLARYMIARWGADPVAWLVTPNALNPSASVERWKRLGQALFAPAERAPVVLMLGRQPDIWQGFRNADWIDVCAYEVTTGEAGVESGSAVWTRPLIACVPHENTPSSATLITADEIRRSTYWGLCLDGPAGISYGAQGIVRWDTSAGPKIGKQVAPKAWQKALFLPGARQMRHLSDLANSIECWKLQPAPKLIGIQPGAEAPRRWITAARSEAHDTTLVYVPEDRTLDLRVEALPSSPNITWFNPRTGENSAAVAVVGEQTCQFPTPDEGDWLLLIKESK